MDGSTGSSALLPAARFGPHHLRHHHSCQSRRLLPPQFHRRRRLANLPPTFVMGASWLMATGHVITSRRLRTALLSQIRSSTIARVSQRMSIPTLSALTEAVRLPPQAHHHCCHHQHQAHHYQLHHHRPHHRLQYLPRHRRPRYLPHHVHHGRRLLRPSSMDHARMATNAVRQRARSKASRRRR